jgi:hypothetical protein
MRYHMRRRGSVYESVDTMIGTTGYSLLHTGLAKEPQRCEVA